MKCTWLWRTGQPRVLVFFAGWGMDSAPFRALGAKQWDVMVCYDYREMDVASEMDGITAYPEMALVAWSLGCAVGNAVCRQRGLNPGQALAINGTLIPEDDEVGIPARWMGATAENLLQGGWEKFVMRMCPDEASRTAFNAGRPERDLAGALEELETLRRLPAPEKCVFDLAVVADRDRIIAPENQRRGWSRHGVRTVSRPGGHFLFHQWASWEEVLACRG